MAASAYVSPYVAEAARRAGIGMSDDQQENEWTAQQRWYRAVDQMRAAIAFMNETSTLKSVKVASFEDWIHDQAVGTAEGWDEEIEEARNP